MLVPKLTAKDICRGKSNGPNETHCLGGWAEFVFKNNSLVRSMVLNKLDKLTGDYVDFNDNTNNKKRDIANLWNRCMKELCLEGKIF